MKKLSKTEARKNIEEFFSDLRDKTPKDIRKIKRFAMKHNIKIGEKRKLFCKVCYNAYIHPSIRVNKGILKIVCDRCENVGRWGIK